MNKKDIFFFIVFLAAITVSTFIDSATGPYKSLLRLIEFCLFTIVCIAMVIENRESKWKIGVAALYFLGGLIAFLHN